MPIYEWKEKGAFRLDTPNSSYCMQVSQYGDLLHTYYGGRIQDMDLSCFTIPFDHAFSPNPPECPDRNYSLDYCLQEMPGNLTGDYRTPAVVLRNEKGEQAIRLKYASAVIIKGKPPLSGLPASYSETEGSAQTLEICLEDTNISAKVFLLYTVFEESDVIARSVRVENCGTDVFYIEKIMSLCMEFCHSDFELLSLPGAWAAERMAEREKLHRGKTVIESRRGTSSHQYNPFFALLSENTTEEWGEAYGFGLVYSGNFIGEAEVDQYATTRLLMGIHPQDFSWRLAPGESFTAPEVVMAYSKEGLGGMSRTCHSFIRKHICRSEWKDKRRPILINNWEATYFDFSKDKLISIAKEAADLGIEMLVMDDGWFGERSSDNSSLGDWYVNEKKLEGGLKPLSDEIHALGLKFGIWIEPEMISENSELYRKHPDWCLHIADRPCTRGRSQLVLDMTRKEVRDYLFERISHLLDSADIEYIKWDMNRHLTDVGSENKEIKWQGEIFHRYVLGLYDLLERITKAYPHLLLEGCSGGGGRFDMGMLYYSPQIWTSDNTDAMDRVLIQCGTSYLYPVSSMGSHVSACPNHQTGRTVSLKTRGIVAMAGTFGYELDPGKLTESEKEEIKEQIIQYKKYYHLINEGEYYRLISPFEQKDVSAWAFVSKDKSEALACFVKMKNRVNEPFFRMKLCGLIADRQYEAEGVGLTFYGSTLMQAGFPIPPAIGDGISYMVHLKML